jgi:hypothetical protein
MTEITAKQQYSKWQTPRQQFLTRAHECSKLTIPTLIPLESEQEQRNLDVQTEQPWQSIGSTGVNTLAAKMLLTLLPPNSPFFKLNMGRKEREELLQLEGPEAEAFKAEIEAALQSMEQETVTQIERTPLRTVLFSVLKHLLVAGNVLLYIGEKPRAFPLYKYVVRRDASGNLLKIVVKEVVDRRTLPEGHLAKAKAAGKVSSKDDKDDEVTIYTVIERSRGDNWTSYQEAYEMEVPGTRGVYKTETLPWVALRMIVVDGEDYGRSYVEELYGDLLSANDLTKAIVQGGMISSKLLWLVNPNGLTDEDDLMNSANGDFVPGRQEDVIALQAAKAGDFSVAERVLTSVTDRLMRSFLMVSSTQRPGERVTAFEIQTMTQEIEDTLGGYYSVLAQELQLPIAKRFMAMLERKGDLPKLPTGSVEPMVVTGIDALGRGQDLTRLRGFIADLTQAAQTNPAVVQRIEDSELIQRLANGHGVDVTGLIKSDEKLAQEQQQAQQQAMMQEAVSKGVGPAVSAMGKAAAEGMNQQ